MCCCWSALNRIWIYFLYADEDGSHESEYGYDYKYDDLKDQSDHTSMEMISAHRANFEKSAAITVNKTYPPECVICLDEFTDENPCILTLCSCGENKALFHLPCLLLWQQDHSFCPVCKKTLYFEVCNTLELTYLMFV